jgi:putative tryptophan/tyrosine transport system substrate-binding protein
MGDAKILHLTKEPKLMVRKLFIILLAATVLHLIVPLELRGGPAPRIPRIGILIPESGPSETATVKGLREELKSLGYIEGENLVVELRDAKGDRSALQTMADELVRMKVDLIFTTGSRPTQAAQSATKEIPIVFRHSADPVALGFLKNMKRPEGNITGVAAFSSYMTDKRLEILKTIVPNLRRVHIFYDSNSKYSGGNFLAAQTAATKLGLEVADHGVKASDEIKPSFDKMQIRAGDAILQISDDLIESNANLLFDGAKKLRLPTMFDQEAWTIKGSLASYGPSYTQMGRQAAQLVDKLLKGAKPGNVPVQSASKFDLVINLRTANIIGLNIAPQTLSKADRIIR